MPARGMTRTLSLAPHADETDYPTNLIARMLYGFGLRVSELPDLRVKDLNLDGNCLLIHGARGKNDRVVNIPPCLRDAPDSGA